MLRLGYHSMVLINLANIEELIFSDNNVRVLLSDLRHIFDQWLLSQRVPTLRSLRLRSFMDLINSLTKDHVRKLEEYFQDSIALDKLDYHIVKNVTLPLNFDANKELSDFVGFGSFSVSRDAEQIYISFWR